MDSLRSAWTPLPAGLKIPKMQSKGDPEVRSHSAPPAGLYSLRTGTKYRSGHSPVVLPLARIGPVWIHDGYKEDIES
jgi:hypothetical protein